MVLLACTATIIAWLQLGTARAKWLHAIKDAIAIYVVLNFSDLSCRIQEMNEDIAALRNALVPSRQARKQRQSQSLFQSNYTWYIGGTALAAVSYACLVYYRNNRSSGGSQLI